MFLLKCNFFIEKNKTLLLAMFSFFMPLSLYLNVNTVILILLLLMAICNNHKIKYDSTLVLVIYFVFLCFSLLNSENLDIGFTMVSKSLPFLLIPLSLVTTETVDEKQFKTISIGLYLGCMLAFLISMVYAISVYKTNPLPLKEGFTYFTNYIDIHSSYYSIYILFSTVLMFWIYRNNKNFNILFKILLLLILVLIQLYLKSRAGLISTAIVILFYCTLNFKKSFAIILVIISVLTIFVFYNYGNQDFLNRNTSESVKDRLSIWMSSKSIIWNNFIIGVGIGDYQYELDRQYYLNLYNQGINEKLNCHNQFLQTFVSRGVIGFLTLMAVFYFLLRKYLKTNIHIILYFLIPILVLMLFDSILVRQHGILFFVFFSTILLKYKPE